MRPLRMPGASGLLTVVQANRPLALSATIAHEQLLPGRTTDLWAYRGSVEGHRVVNPLLRVSRGEMLDVTLVNRLGEDTTIHWHGMHVDERNDGSGMHPVGNGASQRYRFRIDNRAGLYWYHAHPHFRTGAQIHQGLAGLLLIEDEEDEQLRAQLDLRLGDNEIPLIIQDKLIDRHNNFKHSMGEEDWLGNFTLVNWTRQPFLEVTRRVYRLRMLNASNGRTYRLAFMRRDEAMPLQLIGNDGGLLERTQQITEAFLAPAQRLDVLLDLAHVPAGEHIMLRSLAYDPMENEPPGQELPAFHHELAVPMGAAADIMSLRVGESTPKPIPAPAALASMRRIAVADAPVRQFRLHTDGQRWYINGYNYHQDMQAIPVTVRRNQIEIWEIRNEMESMPHPMHLHGFQFQVLGRRDSPDQVRRLSRAANGTTPQDLGWSDTVLIWPGETVKIALDFSHDFKGDQTYMFHCHNLEHEDQGMMMSYRVVG